MRGIGQRAFARQRSVTIEHIGVNAGVAQQPRFAGIACGASHRPAVTAQAVRQRHRRVPQTEAEES